MHRSNRLVRTGRTAARAAAAIVSATLPLLLIFAALAGPGVTACAAGAPKVVIGEDFGHEL